MAAVPDRSPDAQSRQEFEVVPVRRRNQVGRQGTASLAVGKHVRSGSEGVILLARCGVGRTDLLKAACFQSTGEDVDTLVHVQLTVHRGASRARDSREHPIGGTFEVGVVPSFGEVLVPI